MRLSGKFMAVCVAVCAVLLLSEQVKAQKVKDIILESRSGVPLPEELIMGNMRTSEGETLNREVLSEDVKRIYKTGYFKPDIAAEVNELEEGGVNVILRFSLRPLIDEVTLRGNENIGKNRLKEKLTLEEGERLREEAVVSSRNRILSEYEQKGYYRTEVESQVSRKADGKKADVVFSVDEGPRVKVGRISFEGNSSISDDKLRKEFRSRRRWWHFLFNGYYKKRKFENDLSRLRRFYLRHGYLDYELKEVEKTVSENEKRLRINVSLKEGEPYNVKSIEFRGNKYFSDQELGELISQAEGQRLNTAKVRQDVQHIRRKYRDQGYVDAECGSQRVADSEENTVELRYTINEDGMYNVQDVLIEGNRITQDHVIRRELTLHPGDKVTGKALRTSRKRLENLGYFKSVKVNPLPAEDPDKKDVRVTVEEQKTGRVMLGAGYSTEADLVGTVEVSQSNFDWRNWPSFRGGGQKLRAKMQLGTERSQFLLSFTEPWWLHRRLRLQLDAYVTAREEENYTREQTGGKISITRPWFGNWKQKFGLRLEKVSLTDIDSAFESNLSRDEGERHALLFDVIRDTRNNARYPTKGSRIQLGTEVMSEVWGSYSDIYKVQAEVTKYFPVLDDASIKLSGKTSVVDNVSGPEVAIFDRYFAGGAYSIRGFERREVGPVDANNEPVGGKARFEGTMAFLYPFTNSIRGILFCDGGNVWREFSDVDPVELNVSVGVGMKFDLPIGPLRFDYGIPVRTEQDHLEDESGRLHFNLGYMF